MRRILVPLDGSILAEQAIPAGAHMARAFDTTLELVHVIEHPMREDGPEITVTPSPETIKLNLRAAADRYEVDVPVTFNVLIGDPVRRLLQVSERDRDVLIVMATHGRSGVVRSLLGSVADKVVRGASGPVLLIRPSSSGAQTGAHLKTILVGLDGSETSELSLRHAIDLARRTGARLHLVRVVESLWSLAYPTSPYDGAAPDPHLIQELSQSLWDDAIAYLGALASNVREEGIDVTWDVEKGNPVDEIMRAAAKVSAGMIVVTSHGRGGLSRFFQGSVATGLVTRSKLPLLVVPASEVGLAAEVRFEPEITFLL